MTRIVCYGTLCRRGHDFEGTGFSSRCKQAQCIECEKARKRIRYHANRESELARHARYRNRNRELMRHRQALRRAANREKLNRRQRERRAKLLLTNPEKLLAWRRKNPERAREICRESKKRTRRRDPEGCKRYTKQYYARNHMRIRLRHRVHKALKAASVKKTAALKELGINIPAIIAHLGPCPGPRSEWHIDHIRPLASFDLSQPNQVITAFSPLNHQWLPALENLMKNAKYDAQIRL